MERITHSGGVGGEDGESPEADSSEALSPDALAAAYLRGRDVACPGCGYNRRDGVRAACPECRELIEIAAESILLSSLALGTIQLAMAALAILNLVGLLRNGYVFWNWWQSGVLGMLPVWTSVRFYLAITVSVVLVTLAVLSLLQLRRAKRDRLPLGRLPMVTLWIWIGSRLMLTVTSIVLEMLGL